MKFKKSFFWQSIEVTPEELEQLAMQEIKLETPFYNMLEVAIRKILNLKIKK